MWVVVNHAGNLFMISAAELQGIFKEKTAG
jgi:hypothetical protein